MHFFIYGTEVHEEKKRKGAKRSEGFAGHCSNASHWLTKKKNTHASEALYSRFVFGKIYM